jgi:hypothetical protein
MTEPSMMERFAESGFEPVEVDGELVHAMYTTPVAVGDVVRVTWESARSPRVQGLSLRLGIPGRTGRESEGGLLRVDGVQAPTIVLWMDSAPPAVEAECVDLKQGALLRVSNRWRHRDGREDEWLNNYGIRIEPLGDRSVRLHCSDGYGDTPTFDDLLVRIDALEGRAT